MRKSPPSPGEKRRFTMVWTHTFVRTARKFLSRHPDLEGVFESALRQLESDPFAPRLRLHPLKGSHSGKHAVSLTCEYRIVLILHVTGSEIILLDIGTHDAVYRGG